MSKIDTTIRGVIYVVSEIGDTVTTLKSPWAGKRIINLSKKLDMKIGGDSNELKQLEEVVFFGLYESKVYRSHSIAIDGSLDIALTASGELLYIRSSTWGNGLICPAFLASVRESGEYFLEATKFGIPPPPLVEYWNPNLIRRGTLAFKPCDVSDLVAFINYKDKTKLDIEYLFSHMKVDCDDRNNELDQVYNEAVHTALTEKPRLFFEVYCSSSMKGSIDEIVASPISDKFNYNVSEFEKYRVVCPRTFKLIEAIESASEKY